MTRGEKIRLLRDIAARRKTLDDIPGKSLSVWIYWRERDEYNNGHVKQSSKEHEEWSSKNGIRDKDVLIIKPVIVTDQYFKAKH